MYPLHLAIIDDHQVVINGLTAMFTNHPDVRIVFTTTNHQELLRYIEQEPIDVILLDIQMPEISGIDLCKLIRKQHREVKIIAFSSFDDTHLVKQILRNGASGYVLKNADLNTIMKAINTVILDREFVDSNIQKLLVQESLTGQRRSLYEVPLTKREKEILKLIAEEFSNQEIADRLFLSLRTVETHRYNLTQKLDAKNTAALVKEAIKRGLIE
ncbi:response regulator transcription factor [Adhaeribacter swui]|uniref:Response regulator transcription factor n=1 Tax=Adhaeribacter swui TaxID=2086471 RepID=A0A7G7GD84_9BACT|nr:response regulator transcription factor [Adhaeribacter swui]QNF35118.1 response regulator transcription factor [Adhaeribacter swui]